jgi:hypothetical protein
MNSGQPLSQSRQEQVLQRVNPDYAGGGIVNLIASIARHFGLDTGHPLLLEPLPLEGIDTVVLLIADALGYWQLQSHLAAGNLPTLQRLLARHEASLTPLTSTFPTTTAAALTTLHTGATPAEHGLVGFTIWWQECATVVQTLLFRDLLRGTPLAGPSSFVTVPSVYQRLAVSGVDCHAIIPASIAGSTLSAWHFAGAHVHPYTTLETLPDALAQALATGGAEYVVAYWPEYDATCHEHGPASSQAQNAARRVDAALKHLLTTIGDRENTLVIMTADHGQRPLDPADAIVLNDDPVLLGWLASPPFGERCARYLRTQPGTETLVAGHLAWVADVVPMANVWADGLFGGLPADGSFRSRTGDLLAIPRGRCQLHWAFTEAARTEIYRGAHGGWTTWEMMIPLIAIRR